MPASVAGPRSDQHSSEERPKFKHRIMTEMEYDMMYQNVFSRENVLFALPSPLFLLKTERITSSGR